jgi:hypothetical protein
MPLFVRWRRSTWIVLGVGFLIAFCLFGPFILEPTDKPRFEDVAVVSFHHGARGWQTFTVVSKKTGQSWQVGAARGPYPPEYRGPAVLSISRGRWTGKDHLRLVESETLTNRPNAALRPKRGDAVGSSRSRVLFYVAVPPWLSH